MMISPVCFSGYYIMSADHLETSYSHESAKGLFFTACCTLDCKLKGHKKAEGYHAPNISGEFSLG